jgi:predicted RNase H-like nuclease (RuvC/YqgF family)
MDIINKYFFNKVNNNLSIMENSQLVGPIISVLAGIAGTYLTFTKVKQSFQNEIKEEFEIKIKILEGKMEALEKSFEKDVDHIKTTYNSEIKSLSEKIEDLREELRESTNQLIQLLSKIATDK